MDTVQEAETRGEREKGKVREESGEDGALEDAVEEEEVEMRRKVDSELISNNVALVHLLKGNIGIGVMAMPRCPL